MYIDRLRMQQTLKEKTGDCIDVTRRQQEKENGHIEEHTASGTRPALWIRADLTAWKKSTTPSVLSLSN